MSRLTGKDIAEIAKLLDESQFSSLDLTMGEFRLRIRRDGGWSGDAYDGEDEAPAPRPIARATAAPAAPAPSSGPAANEVDVIAPLLGNYYSAPRPGEPPFVQLGDTVGPDTTIGIIEVMKLMNPIRAGVAGTVTALLAENGKAVEEGQALLRVQVGS
ncbi:MAG TPA: biotin/lipoyl-containing protein [Paracoccaceae bacterium]|nr:biotin/lipoyl-containing protein [Paracoccaceae bacterium]